MFIHVSVQPLVVHNFGEVMGADWPDIACDTLF